jgi:hypothetical protein
MATTRPFAYNTGATVSGSTKFGNISVGFAQIDWSTRPGNIDWLTGPDEDLGYVICEPVPDGRPAGTGGTTFLKFRRSKEKTDASFLRMARGLARQRFATAWDARQWLIDNGYWTSWELI